MSQQNKVWIFVGGLAMLGMVFTVWDYRNYLKIERQNYGQGPAEKLISWKVDQLYQNREFRIKYPNSMIQVSSDPVIFENDNVKVVISVKSEKGTLTDSENKMISNLNKNEQMYGERSYENTDRVNMTVINFQRFEGGKTFMVSRYLAKKYDKLFVLEFTTSLENWVNNEGNFREMARTLVLL